MLCTPIQAAPQTAHSLLDNHSINFSEVGEWLPRIPQALNWDAPILFSPQLIGKSGRS